jgi:hypothetical protein
MAEEIEIDKSRVSRHEGSLDMEDFKKKYQA